VSDVVLTNMVTGVPEKMGIGYEELVKIKRDLIMLISSGYGASGPYARRVTMGGAMDGIAGFSWLRHYADQSPDTATYSMHTDVVTSMNNSLAIMMAIYHRWATGKGLLVETSGVEASLHQIPAALMDYALNGRVRVSTGNEDPNGVMAPHNVYPCKGTDAWVTITVTNESQWRSLVRAMGSPEWSQAPRFATMHSRWTHREELDKHIAAWTRTQDKHAAMHTLQETGVPAGAVYDQRDHATDPQWKARGVYQPTQISTAGQYPLATSPWTMDGKRIGIRKPPPGIGQDNEYVFTELMGLRRAEIEALRKEQYIGDKPLELEV
ncbi:MAG: CoA transferase, partial [Chloroflexi bacterium]|nr:CoA transferase [Chloroflexota bacterium]